VHFVRCGAGGWMGVWLADWMACCLNVCCLDV
jgi:hypothetical protein